MTEVADSLFHHTKGRILETVIERLTDSLTNSWLDTHGAELLESIAPGEIQAQVQQTLRNRIAGMLFNGK